MKLKLSKKLLSSLTAVALLLGVSAVNANTISLVDAADNLDSDINIATDLGVGNTFSIDILVNTSEQAGTAAVDLTWNTGLLTLSSVTLNSAAFNPFGAATIGANTATILALASAGSNNIGDYLFATLNFIYTGGGSVGSIDVTGLTSILGGWTEVGSGDTILFDTVSSATVSAVPVPPAMLLFATAIAGLGAVRRRKA